MEASYTRRNTYSSAAFKIVLSWIHVCIIHSILVMSIGDESVSTWEGNQLLPSMRLVLCGLGHQTVQLRHISGLLSPPSLAVAWKAPDIDVVVSSMVPRCEIFAKLHYIVRLHAATKNGFETYHAKSHMFRSPYPIDRCQNRCTGQFRLDLSQKKVTKVELRKIRIALKIISSRPEFECCTLPV